MTAPAVTSPAAAIGPPTRTARVPAIDALRGWCVVSMATAHLAIGSAWWSVMHGAGWIDGAVGFVALSGLVVGMTQHRTVARDGLRAAHTRTARRIGLLLGLHWALCVVALAITAQRPAEAGRLPSASAEGGWGWALGHVATLRVNPPQVSILALYAVMSLLTPIIVLLLASRLTVVACAVSAMIYAYGWFVPAATTFPERAYVSGYVNWATWQALFVAAIVIGWHWNAPVVVRALHRTWLLVAVGLTCVTLGIAGYAATRHLAFAQQPWGDTVDLLFGNGRLGLGTIAFALMAVYVLYPTVRLAGSSPVGRRILTPLALLGQRSLEGYVLIGLTALLYPVYRPYAPDTLEGTLLALTVLAVTLVWATVRAQVRHSRRQAAVPRVAG